MFYAVDNSMSVLLSKSTSISKLIAGTYYLMRFFFTVHDCRAEAINSADLCPNACSHAAFLPPYSQTRV